MNSVQPNIEKSIEILVENIKGLQEPIDQLSNQLRELLDTANSEAQLSGISGKSGKYWRLVTYFNSLIRIKIFIEQNFNYIEPMGLVTVTRYLFELTVWLKLMLQNEQLYGDVYYRELLKTKLKQYEQLRDHLNREVTFLQDMDKQEGDLMTERFIEITKITDVDEQKLAANQLGKNVMQEIDNRASRRFTLYEEAAQFNGYGFQSHQVRTKELPRILNYILEVELKLKEFDSTDTQDIKNRFKRWNWKEQASLTGMTDEYDFIYSYTSTLLHSTPVSVITDEKNLNLGEFKIFLKYIHIRLLDIIKMVEDLLLNSGFII